MVREHLSPGASVIIRRYDTWNAALNAAFADHRSRPRGARRQRPGRGSCSTDLRRRTLLRAERRVDLGYRSLNQAGIRSSATAASVFRPLREPYGDDTHACSRAVAATMVSRLTPLGFSR